MDEDDAGLLVRQRLNGKQCADSLDIVTFCAMKCLYTRVKESCPGLSYRRW